MTMPPQSYPHNTHNNNNTVCRHELTQMRMEKKEKAMPELAQFLRATSSGRKWTLLRWLAVKQKQTNHMNAQKMLITPSNRINAILTCSTNRSHTTSASDRGECTTQGGGGGGGGGCCALSACICLKREFGCASE